DAARAIALVLIESSSRPLGMAFSSLSRRATSFSSAGSSSLWNLPIDYPPAWRDLSLPYTCEGVLPGPVWARLRSCSELGGRDARHRRPRGHVARHDRPRADARTLSDPHPAQDHRTRADRGAILDHDRQQLPVVGSLRLAPVVQ